MLLFFYGFVQILVFKSSSLMMLNMKFKMFMSSPSKSGFNNVLNTGELPVRIRPGMVLLIGASPSIGIGYRWRSCSSWWVMTNCFSPPLSDQISSEYVRIVVSSGRAALYLSRTAPDEFSLDAVQTLALGCSTMLVVIKVRAYFRSRHAHTRRPAASTRRMEKTLRASRRNSSDHRRRWR